MSTNSLERGADRFMNEHMILIYPGSMLKSLDFSKHPRLGQQIFCMALDIHVSHGKIFGDVGAKVFRQRSET
jgi:hypothetical protein